LHVTAQRVAIMQAVSASPHATADAVIAAVRTELGTVSRQAVYDTLHRLVDAGILRRIQPEGSPARFEDRVNDNHHHLICRGCGDVVDIDCVIGAAPCLRTADNHGYDIDEAQVAFWGRCPSCKSNERHETSNA
jgi:Fur family transcriptional regulator, stress-responsive regulator